MQRLFETLTANEACGIAMGWLGANDFKTVEAAWVACPRADWLVWALLTYGETNQIEGWLTMQRAIEETAQLVAHNLPQSLVKQAFAAVRRVSEKRVVVDEEVEDSEIRELVEHVWILYPSYKGSGNRAAMATVDVMSAMLYTTIHANKWNALDVFLDVAVALAQEKRSTTVCADIVRKHFPNPPKRLLEEAA
jgi:hypothetical protein